MDRENDLVDHPSHYVANRIIIEPVDLTELLPHPLASAVEYILRAPFKGSELLDLRKAVWWLRRYAVNVYETNPSIPESAAAYLHVYADRNPIIHELYRGSTLIDTERLVKTISKVLERIKELEAKEGANEHASAL